MPDTKAVVAAICAISAAASAQDLVFPSPPRPPEQPPSSPALAQPLLPWFRVLGSGLVGFDRRTKDHYGFAFDGLVGVSIPRFLDAGLGAGFERLSTRRGPLTALWFDVLAERPAAVAGPFFGLGFGAAFVNRSVHPAARMTAGIEAFPGGPLPLQLGVDLLATWCSDRTEADCAGTQERTYVAGRIGLRL
jgi:hypothetical protein